MRASIQLNIWLLILGVCAFATGLAPSITHATLRERQVAEALLNEGYTFEQSSLQSLLKMIEEGYTWDSTDRWMAYHNLERYAPYSEQTSCEILGLIQRSISRGNAHVDVNRLLAIFVRPPVLYSCAEEKLLDILRRVELGELQRLVAVSLSHYPASKEEAMEALYQSLLWQGGGPSHQILTAFDLLTFGFHAEEAEDALIRQLQQKDTASLVLLVASGPQAELVSDRLLNEMKASLRRFSGGDFRTQRTRFTRIERRRQYLAQRAVQEEDCQILLNGKIVPLTRMK